MKRWAEALARRWEAERAAAESAQTLAPADRWVAVACAVRERGLAHPHEYALIYGSPVPGHIAPTDTVGPASRVAWSSSTSSVPRSWPKP
ncbi:TetR-like C-terminal domain-containing protein [Streptomyces sp. SM13]|uniref:TetR-like C-terminal domain-containing protein n=1 Tax=Streptomyces sp. SM13 TaxID=1983803 RepID=UPI0035BC4CA8